MAYEYKSTRPIAAFSMADYENLTGKGVANFGRGKDKKKRKSRLTQGLKIAGAGLVPAGLALGAARYAVPEYKLRKAQKNFDAKGVLAAKGGAKGQFDRDIDSAKAFGSRVKNYDYKGAPGRAMDSLKGLGSRAGASAGRAADAFKGGKGLGRISGTWASGKAGKAGLIGAAALGGAGLLGAGYGTYKMMKGNKKKGK